MPNVRRIRVVPGDSVAVEVSPYDAFAGGSLEGSRAPPAPWRYTLTRELRPIPKVLFGDPWEEWDDEDRAALVECALDWLDVYAGPSRSRDVGATFEELFIALWPYSMTYRSGLAGRTVVYLDDDEESRDAVAESLRRLNAAGLAEAAIDDYREGSTEVRYVITAAGEEHLRALHES